MLMHADCLDFNYTISNWIPRLKLWYEGPSPSSEQEEEICAERREASQFIATSYLRARARVHTHQHTHTHPHTHTHIHTHTTHSHTHHTHTPHTHHTHTHTHIASLSRWPDSRIRKFTPSPLQTERNVMYVNQLKFGDLRYLMTHVYFICLSRYNGVTVFNHLRTYLLTCLLHGEESYLKS